MSDRLLTRLHDGPRHLRGGAVACCVVLSVFATACGGGGSSTSTTVLTNALVRPPALPLSGCTYMINGKVQPDEVPGVKPAFPPSQPDAAADAAVQHISAHGGTAMVGSILLQPGTNLYNGPDHSQPAAGTVSHSNLLEVFEPVVWVDSAGKSWMATFLACGGPNLYWISVDQADAKIPSGGVLVSTLLAQLRVAPPFTQTGRGSLLPMKLDYTRRLVFVDSRVPFSIGRGQLINYVG